MRNINFDDHDTEKIFSEIDALKDSFEQRNLYKWAEKTYKCHEYILIYHTANNKLSLGLRSWDLREGKNSLNDNKAYDYVFFDDQYIDFKTFLNFVTCYKEYKTNYLRDHKIPMTLEIY